MSGVNLGNCCGGKHFFDKIIGGLLDMSRNQSPYLAIMTEPKVVSFARKSEPFYNLATTPEYQ